MGTTPPFLLPLFLGDSIPCASLQSGGYPARLGSRKPGMTGMYFRSSSQDCCAMRVSMDRASRSSLTGRVKGILIAAPVSPSGFTNTYRPRRSTHRSSAAWSASKGCRQTLSKTHCKRSQGMRSLVWTNRIKWMIHDTAHTRVSSFGVNSASETGNCTRCSYTRKNMQRVCTIIFQGTLQLQ